MISHRSARRVALRVVALCAVPVLTSTAHADVQALKAPAQKTTTTAATPARAAATASTVRSQAASDSTGSRAAVSANSGHDVHATQGATVSQTPQR